MDSETPAGRSDGFDDLLALARRRFGETRAEALKAVLQQTAADLEAMRRFSPQHEEAP